MMTDEKFFAWLDGELDAAEAAEVEARVVADPELARLAEQHRALAGQLKTAFDKVAAAPVPEALQQAVRPPADVIDFAARRERQAARRPALPQWAAIAATLAIGFVGGTMVSGGSGNAPVEVRGGQLYAAAGLDRALDRQLASAAAGDVRIGITFRDQAGAICRSFTNPAASGLACREGGDWRLRGLFTAPEGQSGDYRMAAGADPNLGALIDSTIAGEPFDAAQEQAALRKAWK
ncbi:MAG TPA: anti-sigma factor [Sphingomicrobium sp.]|nr:anti-sigma factor [Sphingomicrobium sp.]